MNTPTREKIGKDKRTIEQENWYRKGHKDEETDRQRIVSSLSLVEKAMGKERKRTNRKGAVKDRHINGTRKWNIYATVKYCYCYVN